MVVFVMSLRRKRSQKELLDLAYSDPKALQILSLLWRKWQEAKQADKEFIGLHFGAIARVIGGPRTTIVKILTFLLNHRLISNDYGQKMIGNQLRIVSLYKPVKELDKIAHVLEDKEPMEEIPA